MVHPELHEKLQCPLDVLEGIFFRTESIQRDFGGQNFFGNLVKEALVLDPHRSHSDLSSDPVSPSSVFLSHHLQHVQNILRHQYFWKRKMLPMEGLATAMFHLPAATWCIASGNSYFHSPNMNGQRCISVDSTRKLLDISQIVAYHEDGSVAATQFVVDNGYVSNNGHACVRLSSTFHEMLVGL